MFGAEKGLLELKKAQRGSLKKKYLMGAKKIDMHPLAVALLTDSLKHHSPKVSYVFQNPIRKKFILGDWDF